MTTPLPVESNRSVSLVVGASQCQVLRRSEESARSTRVSVATARRMESASPLDQRREQVERGDDSSRWAHMNLPGLGTLKLRRTEEQVGRLRSVTLRREGQAWYASITADGVQASRSARRQRARRWASIWA